MEEKAPPGWRQKVEEEHRLLHQSMAGLRGALRLPRPAVGEPGSHTWAAELSQRLVEFHDLLCRHFRYEEKGGMMEDLVAAHPRSAGQVDELIEEHVAVLEGNRKLIGVLLSYSEGDPAANVEVRQRLGAMLDLLGQHERKENALVMDMALDDLGSGE